MLKDCISTYLHFQSNTTIQGPMSYMKRNEHDMEVN